MCSRTLLGGEPYNAWDRILEHDLSKLGVVGNLKPLSGQVRIHTIQMVVRAGSHFCEAVLTRELRCRASARGGGQDNWTWGGLGTHWASTANGGLQSPQASFPVHGTTNWRGPSAHRGSRGSDNSSKSLGFNLME